MSVTILDHWADVLIEQFEGEAVVGASLVRLVRPDAACGEVELGLADIDGHPVDALDGFVAPDSWTAIGVVNGGWVAPMGGVRPSAHPEAQRILQVVLIDRCGEIASRVRYPDGSIMSSPPTYGAVLDVLRAALGLSPLPYPSQPGIGPSRAQRRLSARASRRGTSRRSR